MREKERDDGGEGKIDEVVLEQFVSMCTKRLHLSVHPPPRLYIHRTCVLEIRKRGYVPRNQRYQFRLAGFYQ